MQGMLRDCVAELAIYCVAYRVRFQSSPTRYRC